jgi:hypothetical protein
MRKFFLQVLPFAMALAVAGCATVPPPSITGNVNIDTVLADIKLGCGIIADAGPIQTLIGTVPYLSSADAIAKLACDAFTKVAGVRRGGSSQVAAVANGVPITGHYSQGHRHKVQR